MFRVDPLANPEPLIRRVYSYVAYRVGAGPEAEDITSETFERALRYKKHSCFSRPRISSTGTVIFECCGRRVVEEAMIEKAWR